MRRVKIEVKLIIGSICVKRFETETMFCKSMLDARPLFRVVKRELDKWRKIISF